MEAWSDYEWDEAKRLANITKHGLDFADINGFDWSSARIYEDDRFDYGERRFMAFGWLRERACMVLFTYRGPNLRLIGMRRANAKEQQRHGL